MPQTDGSYGSVKILYLEDEPLIAYDISEFLEDLGFAEIKTAYNLRDAEGAVSTTQFDVAVLDIRVGPDTTSFALGEDLARRGTRVIFASGNGSERTRLLDEGYLFLEKPYKTKVLQEMINHALSAEVS